MAKGIRGREFRPGRPRRRFDPYHRIEILKEVGRPDDTGEDADTYEELVQTVRAHRRVVSGGEGGSDENPTFAKRVEFIGRPRVRVRVPIVSDPAETLGEEAMGSAAMGDARAGEAFAIHGPQAEPGYIVRERDGSRYIIEFVGRLPDKRVVMACRVDTSGGA